MSTVRVLVVTDDWTGGVHGGFLQWGDQAAAAATGPNSREFHLGEFIRVLTDTAWVGFNLEITKAHRSSPSGGVSEAQLKADRGADVVGFRFDTSHSVNGQTRTLASYDMVLYFPIDPGNPDPALAPEAEAIARYMEDGHGFFATGDHANLGSRLAGLIPRVRSMRRWWFPATGSGGEPIAPDPLNANRHDTTQAGPDGVRHFEDQSDEVAQPISPTFYGAGLTVKFGYLGRKSLPHPLLCSPEGVVRYLPDHMHEGWCEVPDDLAARTFTLAGSAVREYPDSGADGPVAPEIVATGRVAAGTTSPALDPEHTGGTTATVGKTFGVIGAWDGHRVSKGRVVVDSTWHHFFNINLTGDRYLENNGLSAAHEQKLHGFYVPDGSGGRVPNGQYKAIMWYFRNIVYWLIPANRRQTIWWTALTDLARHPRIAEELLTVSDHRAVTFGKYVYFGQLAEAYFSGARGACAIYDIKRILYKPIIPWWEWVQDHVDVWDPHRRPGENERAMHEQYLGLLGVGPQPDIASTLGVGAALVTAAVTLREQADDGHRLPSRLDARFKHVFEHAVGTYGEQLAQGRKVHREFERLVERTDKRQH
jgi:hypothetical protein